MNLTGWRTYIVGFLLGALQLIQVIAPGTILPSADQMSTAVDVILALLAPAAMIVMRMVTTTPPAFPTTGAPK